MRISEAAEKLNKYIEDCVFYYDLSGLAVGAGIRVDGVSGSEAGVARETGGAPGCYRFEKAAGYKNISAGELLAPSDIFHMASVTKLFTGTAVMTLSEEKKLNLDDKIVEILGESPIADKRCDAITIEHLMTHTAGLFNDSSLLWTPGEGRFLYSDKGYELLGSAVEKVSGMAFGEYVRKKILLPLGMKNSAIAVEKADGTEGPEACLPERELHGEPKSPPFAVSDTVCPHMKNSERRIETAEPLIYEKGRAASAALISNLDDMERWANAWLYKNPVLRPETYEDMWNKRALSPGGEHMCLSWFTRIREGYELYGHEGSDRGFRSAFWICPELKLHIAVMSNIASAPVRTISDKIFDDLISILL